MLWLQLVLCMSVSATDGCAAIRRCRRSMWAVLDYAAPWPGCALHHKLHRSVFFCLLVYFGGTSARNST